MKQGSESSVNLKEDLTWRGHSKCRGPKPETSEPDLVEGTHVRNGEEIYPKARS